MWKLRAKPFRGLEETGLGVTELCALIFSKTMIATLTGAPFLEDAERALVKLERALPAASRKYLDQLPILVKAKATGRKKQDQRKTREIEMLKVSELEITPGDERLPTHVPIGHHRGRSTG